MADLIKGIDISSIQGNVDFAACKAAGIEFVIIRCGVGNSGKDSNYDKNVIAAMAAGLKVAAYHFVYPLPTIASQPLRDPVKQAQQHVIWAGNTTNVSIICADLEWPLPQDFSKWSCTPTQITQWILTYLQAYEAATKIRPIIYTYPYFAQALNLPQSFADNYKLWIASYEASPAIPKPWTDYVIWQDSGGTQKLPNGVPVDTDKAKDLSLWEVTASSNPLPAPMINSSVAPSTPIAATNLPASINSEPVTNRKPNILILLYQIITGIYNKYLKK